MAEDVQSRREQRPEFQAAFGGTTLATATREIRHAVSVVDRAFRGDHERRRLLAALARFGYLAVDEDGNLLLTLVVLDGDELPNGVTGEAAPWLLPEEIAELNGEASTVLDHRAAVIGALAHVANAAETADEPWCHASPDGECAWHLCPQNREGEPAKSGRHCPLDQEDRG